MKIMNKKLTLFLLGLVLVLSVIVIAAWQVIKVSPQYSIYQIYQATDQHDYDKFRKYVDVESISNNVVDKALSSAINKSKQDTSNKDSFYQLGYNIGLGLVSAMKPQLKKEVVSSIKNAVEEGSFKTEYKPKSIIDYFNAVTVKKNSKVADIAIKSMGKEILKLKMRNVDDHWQVFDMDLPAPKASSLDTSQSETTTKAKFGERVEIGKGWFLIVDTPEEYKPTGYSTPKEGNKYVSIKITYENTTKTPDSYSTYNFKLKDNKDFSYSDTYGGKEPKIDSGNLEAKGKVTGYMTFEMPTENNPLSVVYSGSKSVLFIFPNP